MTLDPKGPRCGCGNIGCWEALASGTALIARARRTLDDPALDGRSLFERARQGDEKALRLVDEEAEWLGIGFVNLLHSFNPGRIVVGGGISAGLDLMQAGIERRINTYAMPAFRGASVVQAELGDNAGLIGVAMLAFEKFSRS